MVSPLDLGALADLIGARLFGNQHCLITGVATLKSAGPGEISFLSNAEYRQDLPSQYRKDLSITKASAVIIREQEAELCPVDKLISPNPRLSLAKALAYFKNTELEIAGIHPSVVIGEGCSIPASVYLGANVVLGKNVILGEQVSIAPGCVIGDNCEIGAHSRLMARVTLYDGVRMGQHCVVYSGAVIGGDGFGFANEKGQWIRLAHLGRVVMGDRVQIGANTTVDRGFLEDTRLEEGVVIDNLVQVGHNATIGKGTAIAGCVAIAGSVSIGQYCLIGGGARIAGHLEIADHVHLTATTGVAHSLHKPGVYGGAPAKPIELWRKNIARFNQLDKMAKRLQTLERHVWDEGEKE